MAASSFNFAFKFFQNGVLAPNFAFLVESFSTKIFSNNLSFFWGGR